MDQTSPGWFLRSTIHNEAALSSTVIHFALGSKKSPLSAVLQWRLPQAGINISVIARHPDGHPTRIRLDMNSIFVFQSHKSYPCALVLWWPPKTGYSVIILIKILLSHRPWRLCYFAIPTSICFPDICYFAIPTSICFPDICYFAIPTSICFPDIFHL